MANNRIRSSSNSRRKKTTIIIIVVALSFALSTAFILPSAAANILLPKKATTKLILEKPPEQVNIGDEIIFTGRLVRQLDYSPVLSATITIFEKGLGGQNPILATGTTDSDGYFRIPWTAFENNGGANRADIDNVADVYAYFQGDLENDLALSIQFRIKATNKSTIEITSGQPFYYVSSTAAITIRITDVAGNLIDPDELHVFFDGMPAKVKRIETGVYRFEHAFLTQGDHKIFADARFRGDQASVGLTSNAVSISSESTIHVVRRPTVLTASIGEISGDTHPAFFYGDKVKVKTMLLDVATGSYITDSSGANAVSASIVRSDNSVEHLVLVPSGSFLIAEYEILESDPTGVWTVDVTFQGTDQLQPSTSQSVKINVNGYRVSTTVAQEAMANVTIINVANHQDSSDIYEIVIDIGSYIDGEATYGSGGLVSFRIPENWNAEFDSSTGTIYLDTAQKPLGAGKSMQFQLQTETLITSFSWAANDIEGNIVATGIWTHGT